MTQCNIGGLLRQKITTNSEYSKTNNLNKVNEQAKATFYVSVDQSYSKQQEVENSFTQNSTNSSVISIGGNYPQTQTSDNFNAWAASI